jgi:tRNA (mo5U34)-methyltransferase
MLDGRLRGLERVRRESTIPPHDGARAICRLAAMSAQELDRRIAEHAFWWHSIDLGNGTVTPGHKPEPVMADELRALQLPDLEGKTVLDIGAWDGYFSFAAERLGASRVVALDYYTWATDPAAVGSRTNEDSAPAEPIEAWDPVNLPGKAGFDLAREALGSEVESVFVDLLTLDPAMLGEFDVVLFLGVLYHSRFPSEMLARVAALTGGTMILETESFSLSGYEDLALGEFFETDELAGDDSNWWSFTEPALAGMCRSSGFATVNFIEPYHRFPPDERGLTRHRALAHAIK